MAWEKEKAAHAAGKRIEFRDGREWRPAPTPTWVHNFDYRIHPDDENKPIIPHADIIRAVLDGKTVQWESHDGWHDIPNTLGGVAEIAEAPDVKHRIKPEPAVRWGPVIGSTRVFGLNMSGTKEDVARNNPGVQQVYRTEWIDNKCVSVTLEDA